MKRIVVTPGGRKRYLEILLRHLRRAQAAGEFDRWVIWMNTRNKEDLAYMQSLPGQYDFIETRTLQIPFEGCLSIYSFFAECVDEDAVYVRLDDDIVFIETGAIKQLIRFRVANPEYFLVFGNIVNNSILTHIHQHLGAIGTKMGANPYSCMAELGWKNPAFAQYVHGEFLLHLKSGTLNRFRFPRWILQDYERVSINCVSWLGSEFKKFDGQVQQDEEHWLTEVKPKKLKMPSCIFGGGLFAHFAFNTQRAELEKTELLKVYNALAPQLSIAA